MELSSILFACLSTNYYSFQFACFYSRQSYLSTRLCVLLFFLFFFCIIIGNKSRHNVDKNCLKH